MEKVDSDDLLVKILSFLPTKDAVRTSVLSKRWEFLWMWLPKLEFDEDNMSLKALNICGPLVKKNPTRIYYMRSESERMRSFIDRNLPIHRAPIIETLRLKLRHEEFKPEDIKFWVSIAVSRSVHELSVTYRWRKSRNDASLPSSLYICKSLVTLKLEGRINVVVPRVFCLPSLRTLHLRQVSYAAESYFQRLLSNCPVLEDLVVEQGKFDSPGCGELSIIVPSLQRLSLKITIGCYNKGFLINTPSLKYFKVVDCYDVSDDSDSDGDSDMASHYSTNDSEFGFGFDTDIDYYSSSPGPSSIIENMPKLEEAYIDFGFPERDKLIRDFIRPITCVKVLSLCLEYITGEDLYREGIVFHQLEHLKLCSHWSHWPELLARLLKDSPNLLKLEICCLGYDHTYSGVDASICFNNQEACGVDKTNYMKIQEGCVPECLSWSLENFKWTSFKGLHKEISLAKYILRNACVLKTATILGLSSNDPKKKLEVIEELSLSTRGSTSCQLVFFE